MNLSEQSKPAPPVPLAAPTDLELKNSQTLTQIADHLRSIRSMIQLVLILSAVGALMQLCLILWQLALGA